MRQLPSHGMIECGAVGETSQRVVRRLMQQVLLLPAGRRDIEADAKHALVLARGRGERLEPQLDPRPFAITASDPELDRAAAAFAEAAVDQAPYGGVVLRMHVVAPVSTDRGRPGEELLELLVPPQEPLLGVGDPDHRGDLFKDLPVGHAIEIHRC